MDEKAAPSTAQDVLTISPAPSTFSALSQNPFISSIRDTYSAFSKRRGALGLSNPGTVDNVSREVSRDVFLTNQMFTGFRAELAKIFSYQPMFQTAHSLSMGNDGSLPPYSFAALYGSPRVFLQSTLDTDYTLAACANYRWNPALVTKTQARFAPGTTGQSMVMLEAEYTGADFTASLKGQNPSILEDSLTGTMTGSYMQSLTPRLALGLETIWSRPSREDGPTTMTAYAARYKGDEWIGSAQLMPQGGLQGSYWRKLSEKIEAGVELSLNFMGLSGGNAAMMMGQAKNEGTAMMGMKYDIRTTTYRGQVDSNGKVSALLEKKITPAVAFTFAGEMDHSKNSARLGMAIQIEGAGSDELAQRQEAAMVRGEQPTAGDGPLPPF